MDKAREFHSGQPLAMPSPYRPQISIRSDNSIRESKSCELLGGRSTGEAVADELAAASALLEAPRAQPVHTPSPGTLRIVNTC